MYSRFEKAPLFFCLGASPLAFVASLQTIKLQIKKDNQEPRVIRHRGASLKYTHLVTSELIPSGLKNHYSFIEDVRMR